MKYAVNKCRECGVTFLGVTFIENREYGFCTEKCMAAYVLRQRAAGRKEHPRKLLEEVVG